MPVRLIRLAVAVLLAALIFPAATVGSSGDTLARKALKVANAANAKATQALTLAVPGIAGHDGRDGANGAAGVNGVDGKNGTDGAPGPRGAEGAAGRVGDTGATGPQGDPGPAGAANLNATSADNASPVTLNTSATIVVSLSIQRDTAGSAFLYWESQINGENGTADSVLCELRVDAATVATRYFSVGGNASVGVTESALVTLDAGTHTAGISCARASTLSNVDVPAERSRLTALAG